MNKICAIAKCDKINLIYKHFCWKFEFMLGVFLVKKKTVNNLLFRWECRVPQCGTEAQRQNEEEKNEEKKMEILIVFSL